MIFQIIISPLDSIWSSWSTWTSIPYVRPNFVRMSSNVQPGTLSDMQKNSNNKFMPSWNVRVKILPTLDHGTPKTKEKRKSTTNVLLGALRDIGSKHLVWRKIWCQFSRLEKFEMGYGYHGGINPKNTSFDY